MRYAPVTCMLFVLFVVSTAGAQQTQRGVIKSAEPSSTAIIVTVDGKELEVHLTDQTSIRGGDITDLASLKKNGDCPPVPA